MLHEVAVDEDATEGRHQQCRQQQHDRQRAQERKFRMRSLDALQQRAIEAGLRAARLELGRRREGQGRAAVAQCELGVREAAAPERGIVHFHFRGADFVDHDEVVAFPVRDEGGLQSPDLGGGHAIAVGLQAGDARGADQGAGAAAIARHAAGGAHLLELDPAAVVTKHAREAGGPALGGAELGDDRCGARHIVIAPGTGAKAAE